MYSENFQSPSIKQFETLATANDIEKTELIEEARQLGHRMYNDGLGNTSEYVTLVYVIVDRTTGQMKPDEEIDFEYLKSVVISLMYPPEEDIVSLSDQFNLDAAVIDNPQPQIIDTNNYAKDVQERSVVEKVRLTEQEVSKKYYSGERQTLAAEIKSERRSNRERLTELHIKSLDLALDLQQDQIDVAEAEIIFKELSAERSLAANTLAGRIRSFVTQKTGLNFKSDLESEAAVKDMEIDLATKQEQQAAIEAELELIKELVDSDTTIQQIKEKLNKHYEKANKGVEILFDRDLRSVEQVMQRTNAFIVHIILTSKELRHNENSNVAAHTNLEDDVDILLSLQPSVSTSSVVPGISSGLWGQGLGTLIAGGEVRTARESDDGTKALGIKQRSEKGSKASAEVVDKYVSSRKSGDGYNEFVVNDPKVAGFFATSSTPDQNNKVIFSTGSLIEKTLTLASQRGVPMFVMSEDRRVYELVSFDDGGMTGSVGREITPKDLAKMPAGISNVKRIEYGERVLQKIPFTSMAAQKEAHVVLKNLGAENGDFSMNREELIEAIKINPKLIKYENIPEDLLSDKDFILAIALSDSVSAYKEASEEVKADFSFVEKMYSIYPHNFFSHILPELQVREDVHLLAIKNEKDLTDILNYFNPKYLDSASVRQALLKRMSSLWTDRKISNKSGEYVRTNIDPITERLINEFGLIEYLNAHNSRLEFELTKDGILAINREVAVT